MFESFPRELVARSFFVGVNASFRILVVFPGIGCPEQYILFSVCLVGAGGYATSIC